MSSWSSNCSGIVGDQVRDSFNSSTNLLHLTELVSSFISSNAVANKSPFHIIEKSKELPSFLNSDHNHKSSRIGFVVSHTTIYFDQPLHHNLGNIRVGKCILEPVSEKDCQW